MNKASIALVMIVGNGEERHLEHCLASVDGLVSEIVCVLDPRTTDGSAAVAERHGARILRHPFTTHAEQFNFGLDEGDVKADWVLRLDCDEYLLPELREEIARLATESPEDVTGYYLPRRVHFMGRWIRHGAYYPTWILRLFRTGKARSEIRDMDEHIVLLGGRAERAENDFVDENLNDLTWFVDRLNGYATREKDTFMRAQGAVAERLDGSQTERKRWIKNNLYYKAPKFFRSTSYFCYRYFLRLGFLDGKEGLIFHFLQGWFYRFLIDAKIEEAEREARKAKA